jgi:hypothetical protein
LCGSDPGTVIILHIVGRRRDSVVDPQLFIIMDPYPDPGQTFPCVPDPGPYPDPDPALKKKRCRN